MGTNSPFQNLFDNFLQAVQDADKSLEVASHFGPNESPESMFEYFWGLGEAHRCLDFNIIESFKTQSQADQLRREGNIYHQRGQLEQALELYNMCISFAPPPLINYTINETSNDINNTQKSTSLAYGFANRSAVLFDLKQYEKAIIDIDCALKYGYPVEQIFKLIGRKAKCLFELNKQQDAITLLNSTINLLSTMEMDEPKKRTKRTKLLSLLNSLQQDQSNSVHCEENIPNGVNSIENLINNRTKNFDFRNGQVNPTSDSSIPRLDSQHASILSVSSALRLQYTTEQGRFFVADRDIKPGELILVEKSPYSCLHLKKDILCSHCCVCLMKCDNPLPCHKCNMVMFCSEACQPEKLNGHTDVDCLTLQTLQSLCVGYYCPLAFKVITQTPYMKLKRLIPDSKMQLTESSLNHYGFNKSGKFDSSDFLSTFAMIDNRSQREGDELFKKVAMSFILTKLLIKSNHYFIDEAGLSFHPSDEDIILLGSTFLTLIMIFYCNAHSLEEFHKTNYDVQKNRGVGAAVFPAQSLLNHSCNPSTVRSSIGSHMTTYAIRFIPKGSEVNDSYGYHYAVHDTEYRQAELKKKYCFECRCEACIGDWTSSKIQSSKLKFKSLNGANVNEQKEKEENIMLKCKQLRSSFQKAYINIIKGDVNTESKEVLIDFIEFLDRYVVLPCKIYHHVQGLLQFCIDKESSKRHPCK